MEVKIFSILAIIHIAMTLTRMLLRSQQITRVQNFTWNVPKNYFNKWQFFILEEYGHYNAAVCARQKNERRWPSRDICENISKIIIICETIISSWTVSLTLTTMCSHMWPHTTCSIHCTLNYSFRMLKNYQRMKRRKKVKKRHLFEWMFYYINSQVVILINCLLWRWVVWLLMTK